MSIELLLKDFDRLEALAKRADEHLHIGKTAIQKDYPDKEYIDSVCQKITTESFSLTAEDIQLVNLVLYRHKYTGIISAYCFPVLPTTE